MIRLRNFALLAAVAAASGPAVAFGQASISGLGLANAYRQNFDGLSGVALPAGWRTNLAQAPKNSATTYAGAASTVDFTAASLSNALTGSYLFNSGGDRALGLLNSNTFTEGKSIFLQLQNDTGGDVTALDLSWNYEKYRSGSRAWQFNFQVSTDGAAWTDVDAGDQAYLADADTVTQFFPPNSIAQSVTLYGLNIPSGADYYLRWVLNSTLNSSNGQGLAIDNFTAVARNEALPPSDANLSVSANTLSFGTNHRLMVGVDAPAQTVTVSELIGGATSTTSAFEVVNSDPKVLINGTPGVLAGPYYSASAPSGGAATFSVDVDTSTKGPFGVRLKINNLSNPADSDNQTVNLDFNSTSNPASLGNVIGNRTLTHTNADFGRVMTNQGVDAIATIATSGVDDQFTRLTVATSSGTDANGVYVASAVDTDGAGPNFDSALDTGTRRLSGSFTTAGVKSGSIVVAVSGEGLLGEVDPTLNLGYTATAVDNRTLSFAVPTTPAVRTITGAAIQSTAIISGGTQTDLQAARLILSAGSTSIGNPDVDGLSVTVAATRAFNGANQTATAAVTATFAAPGLAQSKTIDIVPALVSSGEVLQTPLAAGAVAVIGYSADDSSSDDTFALLTLHNLPAGQYLYITDNGWTGSAYRNGEGLRQMTVLAPLPAGSVINSAGGNPHVAFSNLSGSLDLNTSSGGDQLNVFTSPSAISPLTVTTPIYAFDYTGEFESASNATTGGIPGDLLLNDTAVTFAQSSAKFGAFNLTAISSGSAAEWRAAIANPANWTFSSTGDLASTGSVTVTDGSAGTFGLLTGQTLGSTTLTVNADVLDHSNASFAASDTNALTINFGSVAQGSSASQTFSLLNLLSGANPTANLDLLSITPAGGNSAALSTNLAAFANLAAGGSNGYTATLNTAAAGSFSADYTLNLADEAGIIGGTAQTLTLHLQGTVTPATGGNQYALAGSGPYNQTTSWTQGTIPNSSTAVANFLGSITAPSTVTVSTPVTVNAVNFNNANGYTVAGSTITLAGTATVSVLSGDQTISAPLSVPTAVTFSTAGASTLTTGAVTGAGTATVASNSHVTSSYVRTSSLTVSGSAGNDSALLTIPQTAPLSPFPQGDPAHVSVVNTLNVAHLGGTYYGTIDVGNNDIIVKDGTQATYDDVAAALTSGANIANGFWDGKGIASSLAADFNNADTYGKFGVGYLFNDSDLDPSTIDNPAFGEVPVYDSFDGIALVGRETLIKFTYFGDSNLNGIIDDSDYGAIDSGRYGFGTGWLYGDFDYDGAVTDNDYSLLDAGRAAYDTFSALPAYAPVATVPEPGSIALLVMGGLGLAAAGFRKRQLGDRRRCVNCRGSCSPSSQVRAILP